jgi:hypothetical protein
LTIGTTDKDKAFHPFGLVVSTNEDREAFGFMFKSLKKACLEIHGFDYKPNILVADNAESITHGFASAFGNNFKVNNLICNILFL